jgi:hypothetical protein
VTRPLRTGALALGIVGLLVLVAMAARGGHPGTSGQVSTRPVPNTVQDSFVTLLAIVYVAVIAAIIVGLFRHRSRFQDPHSRWLKNFALVTVLMFIAMVFGYFAITHGYLRHKTAQAQQQQGAPGATRGGRRQAQPLRARPAHFQWPLALGVTGLIVLGGVWIYVRNRRQVVSAQDDQSLEADMVSAIETTIDDLRSERDARRAVIAAYAQMERTLTAHGLGRNRSEAPLEYLGRILRGLHVRDSAVHTLTDLFEYAKFSRHEIDAVMKEQAIDALLAIRTDLRREEELAA